MPTTSSVRGGSGTVVVDSAGTVVAAGSPGAEVVAGAGTVVAAAVVGTGVGRVAEEDESSPLPQPATVRPRAARVAAHVARVT
jgi:hypothetical protein